MYFVNLILHFKIIELYNGIMYQNVLKIYPNTNLSEISKLMLAIYKLIYIN